MGYSGENGKTGRYQSAGADLLKHLGSHVSLPRTVKIDLDLLYPFDWDDGDYYGLHTFNNDGPKYEYKYLINLKSIVQVTCQQELLPALQISYMHSDNNDRKEYVQSGHPECNV